MKINSVWERYCLNRGKKNFKIMAHRSHKPRGQKIINNKKEKLFKFLGEKMVFRKIWGTFSFLFLFLSLPLFPNTIAAFNIQMLSIGINDFDILADFNPFFFAASLFFAIFWLDSASEIEVCKIKHSTKFNAKIRVYEKA